MNNLKSHNPYLRGKYNENWSKEMKNIVCILLISALSYVAYASKFTTVPILSACDMSTASCTSIGVDLNQLNLLAMQAVYTGAPVGTLKVQVSNDNVVVGLGADPASNVVNWTDYTGSSVAISAAGNTLYNMTFAGYRWARIVYTKTSGTGSKIGRAHV